MKSWVAAGISAAPAFLFFLKPAKTSSLPLGDVELVQPADDLDVLADVHGQHLDRAVQHGVIGEQVGGDEQFGEVALALEHERHSAVPVAAVLREQQRVRLALGVVAAAGSVEQAGDRLAGLGADDRGVDVSALGLGEDLGLTAIDPGLRRDDADAGVAVGVHEAQGNDAVEPRVGDPVRHCRPALVAAARRADRLLQRGDGLRLLDPLRRRRCQHHGDAGGHLADERRARPGGEGLQRCGFHQSAIRFPSLRVWMSALRRAARYRSTSSSYSRTPVTPTAEMVLTDTVCFGSEVACRRRRLLLGGDRADRAAPGRRSPRSLPRARGSGRSGSENRRARSPGRSPRSTLS